MLSLTFRRDPAPRPLYYHGWFFFAATMYLLQMACQKDTCIKEAAAAAILCFDGWLRCQLSFAILRTSIMYIRGSRSSFHHPAHEMDIVLAQQRARFPLLEQTKYFYHLHILNCTLCTLFCIVFYLCLIIFFVCLFIFFTFLPCF